MKFLGLDVGTTRMKCGEEPYKCEPKVLDYKAFLLKNLQK